MVTIEQIYADPIFQALNPMGKEFMQERQLSSRLNRFHKLGLPAHALIPFGLFPHIKSIATVGMMMVDYSEGRYKNKHTLVVDSSGNTAHAACRLAPAFGFKHVKVVMSTDVPNSKREILAALSWVEIIQIPTGVAKRAREEGQKPGCYHLDQYKHWGNLMAHRNFTGPEIHRVLGEHIGIIAIAMGSSGTAAGVGKYFKTLGLVDSPIIIGVRPVPGEQVPGTRDEDRMREVVTLPWEDYVDGVVEVSRKESFIAMRRLWGEVEPMPGPSSGLAYAGLLKYLDENFSAKPWLAGTEAAFICPDDGRFYTERTTGELDPDQGIV